MNTIISNFKNIKSIINNSNVNIIAVSKTFSLDHIKPLIDYGHAHFGENKVQEALAKWSFIKKENNHLKLHMIGSLQTNKAKKCFELFDYVHSLDNEKLAKVFFNCEKSSRKKISYFIQVNLGNESQKSGVSSNILDDFFYYCTKDLKLNVIGLMAIPPNVSEATKYFKYLSELNKSLGLKDLSIGMSSDYKEALNFNTTFVRIGSSIFGERKSNL